MSSTIALHMKEKLFFAPKWVKSAKNRAQNIVPRLVKRNFNATFFFNLPLAQVITHNRWIVCAVVAGAWKQNLGQK
jgi:hypothetical protein